MLLLTDLLLRSEDTPALAGEASARTGALLHVVRVHAGGRRLEHNREHPWGVLARDNGGLLWDAWATGEEGTAGRSGVFEHLARPTRIDDMALISATAKPPLVNLASTQLQEGEEIVPKRRLRNLSGSGYNAVYHCQSVIARA